MEGGLLEVRDNPWRGSRGHGDRVRARTAGGSKIVALGYNSALPQPRGPAAGSAPAIASAALADHDVPRQGASWQRVTRRGLAYVVLEWRVVQSSKGYAVIRRFPEALYQNVARCCW